MYYKDIQGNKYSATILANQIMTLIVQLRLRKGTECMTMMVRLSKETVSIDGVRQIEYYY